MIFCRKKNLLFLVKKIYPKNPVFKIKTESGTYRINKRRQRKNQTIFIWDFKTKGNSKKVGSKRSFDI